jgi:hypothetical protein
MSVVMLCVIPGNKTVEVGGHFAPMLPASTGKVVPTKGQCESFRRFPMKRCRRASGDPPLLNNVRGVNLSDRDAGAILRPIEEVCCSCSFPHQKSFSGAKRQLPRRIGTARCRTPIILTATRRVPNIDSGATSPMGEPTLRLVAHNYYKFGAAACFQAWPFV